jgi:DNA-binding PadR family transcriptional regulator
VVARGACRHEGLLGMSLNIASDITSDMSVSVVPRGFSRFYVLSLLRERPMTGKQIMDETERRSRGAWRPSPGLVYPLLARLLSEGLIEEVEGGYRTTDKGVRVLEDYERSQEEFEKRFGAWIRLGLFGRFLAQDLVDRLMGLISMVREDIARLGREQRERYRAFLLSELRRLEEEER